MAEAEAADPQAAAPEAEDTAEDEGEGAPTVKEIIRRVGDLARELEKAEAQRKASLADEAPDDAAAAQGESGDPGEAPAEASWDHAANG
jgi:hypothetical protein